MFQRMSEPAWYPHLTVAAVIEREGQFLCVEEHPRHNHVINQPAGHVEKDESIQKAIRREVLEETGYAFRPEAVIGLYYFTGTNGVSYLRICFCGHIVAKPHPGPVDPEITATHWMNLEQLGLQKLRSPLVLKCVNDYLAGQRYPLDLIDDTV